MYASELFEQNKPRVVVTYPGRFQPFHQGHAGVFAQLQKKFGAENVFVLTSNDTSSEKSPFNFSDKYQLITAAGVPANHVIETNKMYILPDGFDPRSTVFVTAVGAPDKNRLNPDTFTKRDQKDKDGNVIKPAGSPSYYRSWDPKQTPVTADQHGYVVVIPEIQKSVTLNGKSYDASHGTEVRNLWNMVRDNPAARAELLKQLYKNAHQDLVAIFNKIPVTVNESTVNEFARDDDDEWDDRPKFLPWTEFIGDLKAILGDHFDVVEKVVKSTIQARFVPYDPMEFGPTMLYSYYEARAGRNKGAISTRGAIQVGKYIPNSSQLGTRNFITTFNILKGHPFERHFDLTGENVQKIADIIISNTEGAYKVQPQQVKEFAPPGSNDGGDDGFSEETLKRLAAQWYNGDEDPRVERILMAAGWEIGQDEGYDDEPGVFVVQSGDVNGSSYISWPANELRQGLAEGFNSKQEVVDYFVKQGKSAAQGAAAWERGYRGPQPKSKPHQPPKAPNPQQRYWWQDKDDVTEEAAGVGVVAKNKKMAKDPRYSTSITKDVRPGQVKKNLKAFGLAEVRPPDVQGSYSHQWKRMDPVKVPYSQKEMDAINSNTEYWKQNPVKKPPGWDPKYPYSGFYDQLSDTWKVAPKSKEARAISKSTPNPARMPPSPPKGTTVAPNDEYSAIMRQKVQQRSQFTTPPADLKNMPQIERNRPDPLNKSQLPFKTTSVDAATDITAEDSVVQNKKVGKNVKPNTPKNMLRAFRLSETWAQRRRIAETDEGISKAQMMSVIKKFLPLAMQELKIDKLPHIVLEPTLEADDGQASFGRFVNEEEKIYLAMANRHPVDILRTLAHELVHYKQYEDGKMYPGAGETGSPIENQAHVIAGVIMRHFNKKYPNAIKLQQLELGK